MRPERRHWPRYRPPIPVRRSAAQVPRRTRDLVRKKFLEKRILMSKTNMSEVFLHARVDPDEAHIFCYTVGELVVKLLFV